MVRKDVARAAAEGRRPKGEEGESKGRRVGEGGEEKMHEGRGRQTRERRTSEPHKVDRKGGGDESKKGR